MSPETPATTAVRGGLVTFVGDPFLEPAEDCLRYEPDGVVVMEGGRIVRVGAAAELLLGLAPTVDLHEYPDCLIVPGLIDTHVHYVQGGIVGAYGEDLLGWLERYAFPAELAFSDRQHARQHADRFCRRLLAHGTTSAQVFCAVFPESVDALFEAAAEQRMRLIAGKVLMDRHAPSGLLDTPQSSYDDSKALIDRWHGVGRALYAVTPRFAPTSSRAQLEVAGALVAEHEGVRVHSHLSESEAEVAWVRELFPERADYLDVYDHHGLLGPRSLFAHGIHLSESELGRCHGSGAALAHCPTSNLFLGSGLFSLARTRDPARPVEVGLGSDIGGGTSYSLLATLADAYKVARLRGEALDPVQALYLATLGGARAVDLDGTVGALQEGWEADLVVLDPGATPVLADRTSEIDDLEQLLFALMILGDDRTVRATWVAGRLAHERLSA